MSEQPIVELLLGSEPQMVVLVGEPVFRLEQSLRDCLQSSLSERSSVEPQIASCTSIEDYHHTYQGRECDPHDCVMCLDLPDDADQPEIMLGQGCRAAPRLLLVEHSQRTVGAPLLGDEQFFAFGFRLIDKTTDTAGLQRHRYAFSLSDYKRPPDWLNARFWAHPERFDLKD